MDLDLVLKTLVIVRIGFLFRKVGLEAEWVMDFISARLGEEKPSQCLSQRGQYKIMTCTSGTERRGSFHKRCAANGRILYLFLLSHAMSQFLSRLEK